MMTPDQYLVESARTASDQFFINSIPADIVHAIIGVCTEGGESLDVVKKAFFYGKPVDYVNLDEEMGDKLWYIAMYCRARGITIEQLMEQNIKKLRARFPDKFTMEQAITRDLAAERAALEGSDHPDLEAVAGRLA